MKSEIIENSSDIFQPIEVRFTIETQDEADALKLAFSDLLSNEIGTKYHQEAREIWVQALAYLGGLLP